VSGLLDDLPRPVRLAGGAVALVFLVGGAGLVLGKTFTPFLASPAWVAAARPWAIGFGTLFAAATLPMAGYSLVKARGGLSARTAAVLVFGAALLWFIGAGIVYEGPPMLRAAVAGQPVELTFTVTSARGDGGRYCRERVELADLPFLFGELCGVPDSVRGDLAPGSLIVVSGRGTAWGLFADRVRKGP
jgi:hypothetical protein